MRQVFSSPRLENVERVAELLREQGIEVRVTNGRSYRGARRGTFSYRESANEDPPAAVWVVKSEDQPQARDILREAGLLDSGRSPTRYIDVSSPQFRDAGIEALARKRAFRLRAGLMLGIAIALAFGLMAWHRAGPADAPVATAPVQAPAAATDDTVFDPQAALDGKRYAVATPSALAAMLIDAELEAHDAKTVCLSVDAADPTQTVLAQLKAAEGRALVPHSSCAGAATALTIAVADYRTDGSGTGSVVLELRDTGADGKPRSERRTLEVRRDDERWDILKVASR